MDSAFPFNKRITSVGLQMGKQFGEQNPTIAGLLAQEIDPFEAAGLGVYLHAAAAELYAADYGPSGLLASEVAAGVARAAGQLRRGV